MIVSWPHGRASETLGGPLAVMLPSGIWSCPGGEPYMAPNLDCNVECVRTIEEVQQLMSTTFAAGMDCAPRPVETTSGTILYSTLGPAAAPPSAPTTAPPPTAPTPAAVTTPAPAPTSPVTAEPQTAIQPARPAEPQLDDEGRIVMSTPLTAPGEPVDLPAKAKSIFSRVPWWGWLLVIALLMLALRKERR
jgi:hypothetical protein